MKQSILRNPSDRPLFTGRELVSLIIPFVLGYIMSLLVGMLDTAMVSTVGEEAVSGVSLVDNMMQLAVFVFMAFATGGSVVAGQYLGNRDRDTARESTAQLLFMAGNVSVIIMTLIFIFRRGLVMLFFGSITPEVETETQIYLLITVFSLPAMALYECEMASFRAMGEAKITMYVSLVMNLVNVIGNAVLIFLFHMGTAGVAWPTLVSRWVGALAGFILLFNHKRSIYLDLKEKFRLNLSLITKILRVGLPNGVENGIFQLGKILVLSFISGFGTQAIAANAVAVILTNIVSIPGWGMNQAIMTVVSRSVGADDYPQAEYYNRLLTMMTSLVIAVWSGLIFLGLPWILQIFSLSDTAVRIARAMIGIHIVGSILFWPAAFMVPASMRAAGDAGFVMVISILSMWVFRVGGAWLLCRHTSMGAPAVWLAMVIDWTFRAVVFWIYWSKGRWKTKRII